LGGLAVACSFASAADTFPPEQIEFFEKNVRPVLAERCYECHGAHKHQNGLRLDSRAAVLRGSDYGKVVEPGNPSASKLIKAINHARRRRGDAEEGRQAARAQIAALEKWISLGLPWPRRRPWSITHRRPIRCSIGPSAGEKARPARRVHGESHRCLRRR
jgi:hypothetical protein